MLSCSIVSYTGVIGSCKISRQKAKSADFHDDLVTYFDFVLFVIPGDICMFIGKDKSFIGSVKAMICSVYQFK